MQKNFKIKLDSIGSKFAGEHANFSNLNKIFLAKRIKVIDLNRT